MKLKAPEGKVLKAYMISYNRFRERVLIDEHGLVLTPGMGWVNAQNAKETKLVPLPEPIKLWDNFALWDQWWEKKAWTDPAWGWYYYNRDES